MSTVTRSRVLNLIDGAATRGRIFGLTYVGANGTPKKITASTHGKQVNLTSKGTFTVYDTLTRTHRAVPVSGLKSIRTNGVEFQVKN